MTRKLPDLLAKVRELKALGLSAWMYTSNFRYPPVTLTQSVADDVALVSEVLGAKLAMGDVNGSFPSSQAILEMLANSSGCRHSQQTRSVACPPGLNSQSV